MLSKKSRQAILGSVIVGSLSLLFFCFGLFNIEPVYAWNIAYPAPGVYSLRPKCAPNAELSTAGLGKSNGTNVVLRPISSNNIKWRIARVGNTEWYTISVDGTNIGLNVDNGRPVSGTNITLWETKGAWQQFRFWDVGGGYYLLQGNIGGSQAMVLDVAGGGSDPNANVWSYGHNNSDAQLWKLVKPSEEPTTQRGYINTQSKNLNLRRTPNGTIIGKLAKNTPVTILQGNSNGWTKVQTDSGQVGYVSSQYVAIGEPTPPTPPPTTQKGYINTQSKNLNLRSSPNGAIIGKLAKNTPVTILQGNSNGWTKVQTDSGQVGYVSSQYVAIGEPPTPPPPSGNVKDRLLNAVFKKSGGYISCDFDGYKNTNGRHEGIDLVLSHKAPVYAVISGKVTRAGGAYNTVTIYDQNNNKTVVYLHFDSVAVRQGQYVNKGDLVGYQGMNGAPQGSHVHIEVRDGNKTSAAKSVNDPVLNNPNPYDYWNKVL